MVSNIAILKTGVTQPVILSLEDAKSHLNITHSYQDSLIQSYIDVAISEAQGYTSRSLQTYAVTIKTTKFENRLILTLTPYLSGLAIQYYDTNNTLQTLDASAYVLGYHFGEPVIYFNNESTLPSLHSRQDAVIITYDAGYGLESMPVQFTQFCKLMVGTFYENRTDSVDKLPRLAYNLIHKYKLQWQ
jgi:uncharacterized phiE125 gp8 family phage protein